MEPMSPERLEHLELNAKYADSDWLAEACREIRRCWEEIEDLRDVNATAERYKTDGVKDMTRYEDYRVTRQRWTEERVKDREAMRAADAVLGEDDLGATIHRYTRGAAHPAGEAGVKMLVETIEYPKDKAREQYELYRAQLKKVHDKQTEMLTKAYKAASKGMKLLDLQRVLPRVGVDGQGRPKIAIARAGHEFVWYRKTSADDPAIFTTKAGWGGDGDFWHGYNFYTVIVPYVDWPKHHAQVRAQVPIVPPEHRPKWKLTNYHLLFEPEWERVPPTDPILLRHIGGTLYVVLAQWDLTEIERAVMAQAFV